MLLPAFVLTSEGQKIKKFFEDLGYHVSWDFSNRYGGFWWEFLDDNREIIAQIDMGVSLEYIVEDLCCFHLGNNKGIDRPDKPDYKVNGVGDQFDEMLKKVYENNHNRP